MKLSNTLLLAALGISSCSAADAKDEHPIILLNKDESFHFELLVPFGEAIAGGADINPILQAAKNITPGDMDSFSEVFHTLANETKAEAENPDYAYDPVNVRDTWFAAATYFRRADFYLHGNWENPLINSLWEEQTAAFNKGLAALPHPGERIRVKADNFTVEAIWYSESEHTQRPTLIIGNGYDGAQEDLYHVLVAGALARGWNALTYEGPGHPSVRRKQNLGFIPDWEHVVTPLVDYLLAEKRAAVDADKLALFGYSFGGYHAARAAAFEPRIKAVLCNGGVWDTYESFGSQLTPEMVELFDSGNKTAFDKAITAFRNSPNVPTQVAWGIDQGLWSFKAKSPYDFFQMTKQHTLKNVVHRVKAPVWIADAEYEGFFSGQSAKVKKALGDLAELHVFRGAAGYHCQSGAAQEMMRVMFSWLHKTLDV
ncbi:hypothetical protein FALBO_13703 [Fusarium albosuccineum]|uniref:Peptidase S9 prolyl oligopeptidase catalytic domain-containing protein n=1 Tax=Fusarium albosuccineum TaxID=1237068 RepID=A0A8H4P1Y6_9HYPO|nr:hypothetical protein FALBO_13703 [Fusarium albosuccineum]